MSQLILTEWQSELEDLRLISQRVKLFTLPWFPISSNPKKLLHTSGSRAAWPCQALRDVKRQFYCFCILVIVSISVCTQGNCGENTFSNLKRHSLCYTTDAHLCVWGKLLNYQHSDSELKHEEKFNVNPPVISWLLPRLGRVHFRRASLCIRQSKSWSGIYKTFVQAQVKSPNKIIFKKNNDTNSIHVQCPPNNIKLICGIISDCFNDLMMDWANL